jgi:transposase-like protein
MEKRKAKRYSPEFKVAAVRRMQAGESASRLAKELGVLRKLLYQWKQRVQEGGEANIQGRRGRPSNVEAAEKTQSSSGANQRIAKLERLVGQQQALIDFFEKALQAVEQLPGSEAGKARSLKASGKKPVVTTGERGSGKP